MPQFPNNNKNSHKSNETDRMSFLSRLFCCCIPKKSHNSNIEIDNRPLLYNEDKPKNNHRQTIFNKKIFNNSKKQPIETDTGWYENMQNKDIQLATWDELEALNHQKFR